MAIFLPTKSWRCNSILSQIFIATQSTIRSHAAWHCDELVHEVTSHNLWSTEDASTCMQKEKQRGSARNGHGAVGSAARREGGGARFFSVAGRSPAALGVGAARTAATLKQGEKEAASYWGVAPARLVKEDGTEWKWSCFRPWDAYEADVSIDLTKHHRPATLGDKVALWTVKAMRWPTDLFFQRRYGCRAMMLETVAAVPGMVAGAVLHLRSLRRFEQSGGWIRALLEEAENERMHLMTFMEVSQPRWYERALVVAVQGVFFHAYLATYLASPKVAHRMVGYLEEEAVHSYTEFLRDLEAGKIDGVPAPAIAIDYWRLPAGATLKDVVRVVRADEAHHRDVNHYASDIHCQGHALREVAAPIGYH
uniref:Ubiquinol oxidase n=1 Tax=Aegilops tauschii TaxID=37682 RepID=M8BTK1_AEGTA